MMERNEQGKWAQGSIRISSDILSPDEITALIGLEPTSTLKKGDRFMPGRPRSAIAVANIWILDSGLGSEYAVTSHLDVCLSRLEGREASLTEITTGAYIDVFLGFASESGQGGFTLDHARLNRLSRLPVSMTLDLYPSAADADRVVEADRGAVPD